MDSSLIPELRFPEFEGEWSFHKFSEVTIKIQDGTHFSPPINDVKDFKYITSKNIRPGKLDLSDVDYISKEEHAKIYKRADVKYGDVLLTKDGASTGNVCINNLTEEFSLLSSVAFMRADGKNTTNEFIFQLISSQKGQKEIFKSIAGQAITRITLNKLRGFKFAFPSAPEQQKIATFLCAVDKRISLLKKKKSELELYKKGVMQKLFSQEIRFKDENGNDFPDWEEKRLGDIGEISKGVQLNKVELEGAGTYPAINGGIEPSGYTEKWNRVENTITISEGGNSCGYVNLIKTKFWSGGHCYSIVNIKDGVINNFLYHFLKFNQHQIMRLRVGSGLPNIQKGSVVNFKILLPQKSAQIKIANFLSSIDKSIASLSSQIEGSVMFKQGLLQKMFV